MLIHVVSHPVHSTRSPGLQTHQGVAHILQVYFNYLKAEIVRQITPNTCHLLVQLQVGVF